MTPNQELYATALRIAVMLLGPKNVAPDGKQSTFNLKFQDYRNIAKFISADIHNDPKGLTP